MLPFIDTINKNSKKIYYDKWQLKTGWLNMKFEMAWGFITKSDFSLLREQGDVEDMSYFLI